MAPVKRPITRGINTVTFNRSPSKRTPSSTSSRIRKQTRIAPFLGTSTMVLKVGEAKTLFVAHKILLTSNSEFIRAATQWPTYNGTVTIESEDASRFNVFVKFCYTGNIFTEVAPNSVDGFEDKDKDKDDDEDKDEDESKDGDEDENGTIVVAGGNSSARRTATTTAASTTATRISTTPSPSRSSSRSSSSGFKASTDAEWTVLIELYLLGDRMLAPAFQNAVIDAMVEKAQETRCLPADQACLIYNNTIAGSKLRELVVDFHVFGFRGEMMRKRAETEAEGERRSGRGRKGGAGAAWASPDADGPKEFVQDVLEKFVKAGGELHHRMRIMPWIKNPCAVYHEHTGTCCRR